MSRSYHSSHHGQFSTYRHVNWAPSRGRGRILPPFRNPRLFRNVVAQCYPCGQPAQGARNDGLSCSTLCRKKGVMLMEVKVVR